MSSIFNEAAAKSKRELVIKKATKSPEALAVENGEVDLVFCVSTLNHLVISGFPELTHLSPKIGQLQQLFQLVLTDGAITNLPTEIGSLTKLKLLDVSRNKLDSVPGSLYSLGSLHTLILRHNCLSDDSFPSDLPTDCCPNLHHLDIVGNCLTCLPNFVYHSKGLQELIALDNNIASLEPAISDLSNLKLIDMKRNKLTLLPFELSLCLKLKSLDLVDNPISDRRLLKLVTQLGPVKPKTVLDYVASHSPKPSSPEKKGKSKRRAGAGSGAAEGDDEVEFSDNKPRLVVVRPAEYAEVLVHPEARRIRPFLICAIVRAVDLASNNNFKKFINLQVLYVPINPCHQGPLLIYKLWHSNFCTYCVVFILSSLQTKLHDGVCKRRRAATVATHDLAKLALPLSYCAHSAGGIMMTPLGDATPISIREFLSGLEGSKTDKRGGGGKKGGKKAAAVVDKETDSTKAALSK